MDKGEQNPTVLPGFSYDFTLQVIVPSTARNAAKQKWYQPTPRTHKSHFDRRRCGEIRQDAQTSIRT